MAKRSKGNKPTASRRSGGWLKGLRVQRRIPIIPGFLILNVSKSGVSFTVGRPGRRLNVGRDGARVTLGAPGTGVSYRRGLSWRKLTDFLRGLLGGDDFE